MSRSPFLYRDGEPPTDGLTLLDISRYTQSPKILMALDKLGVATATMISKETGYDNSGTGKMLKWLSRMGLVQKRDKLYSLTDNGRMCAKSFKAIVEYGDRMLKDADVIETETMAKRSAEVA